MQQPDLRQVGADKPTTQLKNSLGLCLHLEGFDMVGLEAVTDLKWSRQELACCPMSTAHTHSKINTYFLQPYHVTHDNTLLLVYLINDPPRMFTSKYNGHQVQKIIFLISTPFYCLPYFGCFID